MGQNGNGSPEIIRVCTFGDEKAKTHVKSGCVPLWCCPSQLLTRLQHELPQPSEFLQDLAEILRGLDFGVVQK
jgi:hypothetical protein